MSDQARCRTYWGSHGCDLPRGHESWCICWECYDADDMEGYVGMHPYYGKATRFYGEDAKLRQEMFDR